MNKRLCAAVLIGAALAGGCADTREQYTREGVTYGTTKGVFRGRWWSFYERGVSFLNGKYYAEAAADFEEALRGRSDDSWRARTYGLHFVEYFPNRELGIAYFYLERYAEAEDYLNRSLAQIDTDRAHYYIDQLTRAKISSGEIQDNAAPALIMSLPTEDSAPATPVAAEVVVPEPAVAPEPVAVAPQPVEEAPKVAEAPKPAPMPEPAAEAPKVAEAPKPAPAAPKPEPVAEAPKVAAAPEPAPAPVPVPVSKPVMVSEPVLALDIEADDDVGVAEVSVNNTPLPQRKSQEKITFSEEIPLAEGQHSIDVKATDLADKEQTQQVKVTVDLSGPTIGVFAPIEPTITESGTIQLEGASVDKNGVVAVDVDTNVVAQSKGDPRLEFFTELPLGDGENSFVLASRDVAGNETRSAVKVFRGDPESFEAKLWLMQQKLEQAPILLASNEPIALQLLVAQVEAPKEGEIRMKTPREGQPYRHNRSLRIAGEVVAQTPLASLSINGVPVDPLTGAPKESFNKRLPIDPALLADGAETVKVTIEAVDTAGKALSRSFDVDVRPVDLQSKDSHMPVAVLAFGAQGVDDAVATSLRTEAESSLFQQGRFQIVDRLRLQDVLTEQQLSEALGNPEQALSLGRLTPAQAFVVADVFGRDTEGVEIKARVVSTESSTLLGTLDVFITNKNDLALMKQGCANLAAQLRDLFPRLSGEIVSVRGQDLLLNWTAEDGLREGAYVLLVQEQPPWLDETTGEVLEPGEFKIIGRAQVTGVSDTNTRARAVGDMEGVTLEQGMPAVTM